MTNKIQQKLIQLRKDMSNNNEKKVIININIRELNMIITSLKIYNAIEDVIDEEINLKHNNVE